MSEAHRGDAAHADDPAQNADRDAKIEQLLLVGLDHYFAAQYDQAINVWTRALFLDRSHPRARAYIERARSAVAERQRQSEELLHTGVAAFQRGEGDEARRLLRAAIDGGAPPDEALAVLERLDRLETTLASPDAPRSRYDRQAGTARAAGKGSRSTVGVVATMLAVAAALALGGYAALPTVDAMWRSWLAAQTVQPAQAAPPVVHEQSLALPRRGEMALARARSLAAGGHLSDALAVLDLVRPTDAQRADADELRADIQRQLLALVSIPPQAPRDREKASKGESRVP
jgi:tetratricopeptide (TPR) repeat protein